MSSYMTSQKIIDNGKKIEKTFWDISTKKVVYTLTYSKSFSDDGSSPSDLSNFYIDDLDYTYQQKIKEYDEEEDDESHHPKYTEPPTSYKLVGENDDNMKLEFDFCKYFDDASKSDLEVYVELTNSTPTQPIDIPKSLNSGELCMYEWKYV